MAAQALRLSCSLMVVILCLAVSAESRDIGTNGDDRILPKIWCIAVPGSNAVVLQQNIDSICGQIDCSTINPGGACYNPVAIESHATVALNLYYKARGTCTYPNSMFTFTNPSFGSCTFP